MGLKLESVKSNKEMYDQAVYLYPIFTQMMYEIAVGI